MNGQSFPILKKAAQRRGFLTAADESALAAQIRNGDSAARATLVESHLPLVLRIAHNHRNGCVPIEDLVSAGLVGLLDAADRFDPARGARFSTFAFLLIRQHIVHALRTQSDTLHTPEHAARFRYGIESAESELRWRLRREPTDEEIATHKGVTARRVRSARAHPSILSLDAPMKEDGALLGELCADDSASDPAATEEANDTMARLNRALEDLPARERLIIALRHGLQGNREHTLLEIADHLGLSKERVRQLEELTRVRLRRTLAASFAPERGS